MLELAPMKSLQHFAEIAQQLLASIRSFETATRKLKLPGCAGEEWYELLEQKIVPQLTDEKYLVAAVVGGTNIGKSVIFNHLAGSRSSATNPLASGTKHPLCLVPRRFECDHDLAKIFEGFRLESWRSDEDTLREDEEHILFWKESDVLPANLLILDTPDIDSDAVVNWERADRVRRSADVLIGVLTQQKYNDAAVKKFFRESALQEKAIILVFNQCRFPEDEEYWPMWLETFCQETGTSPEYVYLAPYDREAAEGNLLPFYLRSPIANGDNRTGSPDRYRKGARDTHPQLSDRDKTSHNLLDDISRLKFPEIKLRSLRGAVNRVVNSTSGIHAWLGRIDRYHERYQTVNEQFSAEKILQIERWPILANSKFVEAIREWWRSERHGWSARVHGFYNSLGRGITWPVRKIRGQFQSEKTDPWQEYSRKEWSLMIDVIGKIYDRIAMLHEGGYDFLQEQLHPMIAGHRKEEFLQTLKTEYDRENFPGELEHLVDEKMRLFREEKPQYYKLISRLDQTAAVARPAVSVALFVTGFGPAGHVTAHFVTDSAMQTAAQVVGDVTGGTVAALVGDAALSETASTGTGYLEAWFRGLHREFIARRVRWLLETIQTHLCGELFEVLSDGAILDKHPDLEIIRTFCGQLEELTKNSLTHSDQL